MTVKDVTLFALAEAGDLVALQERLEAGEDVNGREPDGRVPLHAALGEGNLDAVRLLLEYGADPGIVDSSGFGLLHWATFANSRAILDVARDAAGEPLDVVDEKGTTPLSRAARGNDCIAVSWLLEHGADPNRADLDGWTPLHLAAAEGNADVIERLLRAGADPLCRLKPSKGEDFGHLASDLAWHYAWPQALHLLEAAEAEQT